MNSWRPCTARRVLNKGAPPRSVVMAWNPVGVQGESDRQRELLDVESVAGHLLEPDDLCCWASITNCNASAASGPPIRSGKPSIDNTGRWSNARSRG